LIQLSRDLPIHEVPLDAIPEVDSDYWFRYGPVIPRVRRVVEHMQLITEVDLSYPIILAADGRVMDGSTEWPEPELVPDIVEVKRWSPA